MIQPRNDWLCLKMPRTQERTEGGIYIPLTVAEGNPPMEGTVLAGGGQAMEFLEEHGADIGARVLFEQFCGLEQRDADWGEVLLIRVKDLLGVLEK